MKSENKNLLDSTTNHLKSFTNGLKKVSDELSEQEFEQYLKADVLPMLLEDEVVYDDSIWSKMDVVKTVHIDSTLDYRGLSMESAIRKMNVKAVCWMLQHLDSMKSVISDSKFAQKLESVESHNLNTLQDDCDQLQDWINEDLYERLQEYQNEIKSR